MTNPSPAPVDQAGPAEPDPPTASAPPDADPEDRPRDWIRLAFWLVTALALGVRASVLKDASFITDDFMLSARAMENAFSWGYLTRVHTGHFEPIGFGIMWALAHFAPLQWGWTVVALLAGQLLVSVLVWQLLRELFGRRPLILLPYLVFVFTPLTLPAVAWLSAAILWLPLMAALAGALRWHTRYVRTGSRPAALAAVAWFLVGCASFEKIAIFVPYVIVFTLALDPGTRLRVRPVLGLVRRTWLVWAGYAVAGLLYLAIYLPGYRSLGNDTPVTAPHAGTLSEFAFLSIFRTLIPASFGGPWSWQRVSYALGIVDSPRAFDWACWVLALVVIAGSLLVRRQVMRFWVALLVYLGGSILTVAAGRVAYGGSIVALETRYLADAAVPLVIALGAALLPVQGQARPWTPIGQRLRTTIPAPVWHGVAVAAALVVVTLSFHSMGRYATITTSNPTRPFLENTKSSLAALPDDAQIVDTEVPGAVIGPIFGEYNLVSRYLSPLLDTNRRADARNRVAYTNPYILDHTGTLVPMAVTTVVPSAGEGCRVVDDGRVVVPLAGPVFEWSWLVRIGYLADAPVTGTVRLGTGSATVPFGKGLGEVFVRVTGSGTRLTVTGLPDGVNFCVGDAQVGTPTPKG